MNLNSRIKTLLIAMSLTCAAAITAIAEISGPQSEGMPGAIALFNEGYDLLVQEKYAEAQGKFEAALGKHEKFAQAHNNLAFALRMLGPENYEQSLKHYARAIDISPRMPEPYAYRGTLYVLMGKLDLARQDYEKLRGLKPRLAEQLLQVIQSGATGKGELLYAASKKIYRPDQPANGPVTAK